MPEARAPAIQLSPNGVDERAASAMVIFHRGDFADISRPSFHDFADILIRFDPPAARHAHAVDDAPSRPSAVRLRRYCAMRVSSDGAAIFIARRAYSLRRDAMP